MFLKHRTLTPPKAKIYDKVRDLGGLSIPFLRRSLVSHLAGPVAEHKFSTGAWWIAKDMAAGRRLLDMTSLTKEQRQAVRE
jgi:hypothetical protein